MEYGCESWKSEYEVSIGLAPRDGELSPSDPETPEPFNSPFRGWNTGRSSDSNFLHDLRQSVKAWGPAAKYREINSNFVFLAFEVAKLQFFFDLSFLNYEVPGSMKYDFSLTIEFFRFKKIHFRSPSSHLPRYITPLHSMHQFDVCTNVHHKAELLIINLCDNKTTPMCEVKH